MAENEIFAIFAILSGRPPSGPEAEGPPKALIPIKPFASWQNIWQPKRSKRFLRSTESLIQTPALQRVKLLYLPTVSLTLQSISRQTRRTTAHAAHFSSSWANVVRLLIISRAKTSRDTGRLSRSSVSADNKGKTKKGDGRKAVSPFFLIGHTILY